MCVSLYECVCVRASVAFLCGSVGCGHRLLISLIVNKSQPRDDLIIDARIRNGQTTTTTQLQQQQQQHEEQQHKKKILKIVAKQFVRAAKWKGLEGRGKRLEGVVTQSDNKGRRGGGGWRNQRRGVGVPERGWGIKHGK